MEVIHRRCAGLDVHQAQVAACVRVTPESGPPWAQASRFETTPSGIAELRAWLMRHQVTHVAMEGTGVYWLPIFTALESGFDLTLCNAHHVKNVPGRKTDQSDAAWLAQLLASGLLRKSFVPPADVRQVRELTRARVHRSEDRVRVVNALHRLLERAGVKLCSVIADLQGKSARTILEALASGETDARALADLARGSLRGKRAELAAVLAVPLSPVERMMLKQLLDQLALCDRQVDEIDEEVTRLARPWQTTVDRLKTAPGVDHVAAMAIIAELGPDVASFDDAHRLAAWAGLSPGQRESAGRRKRTGTRSGNAYLRRILVQSAMAISRCRKNPSDLTDFFRKKMPVLGYKKAAVATAHKLLVRIWTMLHNAQDYAPPPPRPLSDRQRQRRVQRALVTLRSLGVDVAIRPAAA